MGVISQDRDTAIAGSLGKRAAMVPLDISVTQRYEARRELSHADGQRPLPVAVPAADGAVSPRSMPPSAPRAFPASWCTAPIEFENRKEPVQLQNIYAGDGGSAMQAATATAVPLAYLMQAGFDQLKVKRISLQLESFDVKKELNIGQVYLSRKEVKPGDTIELMTQLDGENGVELTRSLKYTIPLGTAPGTLYFTVADGTQTGSCRVEADHRRNAALARAVHLHSGPFASERQSLRAGLARRTRL